MWLALTTTHQPATDLGYLLVKHPDRFQTFPLPYGKAHVFYPVAETQRCTAVLMLELDPVSLVRGGPDTSGLTHGPLWQYINDRPYVASSFLSVAIAQVFGSALKGRSVDRPELAKQAIPLEAELPVVPSRGGLSLVRRLFEPLGYHVQAKPLPLDTHFPHWGLSPYYHLRLTATCPLSRLLNHLYVLLPVLDDEKHYWVGRAEVAKLVEKGKGWLEEHPEGPEIVRRYLKRQPHLVRQAMAQLFREEDPDVEREADQAQREEQELEQPLRLHEKRIGSVVAVLRSAGARRVADLGCGEGKLLKVLLDDPSFELIIGLDVSLRALERARDRLRLDQLPPDQRRRITLLHGAITYRDRRLCGLDAACLMEVIEHLEPERLVAMERAVFQFARPTVVVVTTPNAEYNVRFPALPAGPFRHRDHQFEWTREEFQRWARAVAERTGYQVRFLPVGEEDPEVGPPTQMAVFQQ